MPQDALFIHLISALLISQICSLLDKYSVCSLPPAAKRRRRVEYAEGGQTHVRDSKSLVMGSR